MRQHITILTALTFFMFPFASFSGDGVLEISQTCAESSDGCFSGDSAGFPVTITAQGSYMLTSNLVLPNANTDGIRVQASTVSINLNGFSILGLGTAGTGAGIRANVSGSDNLTVRDGTVEAMGAEGIYIDTSTGSGNQILRVRVIDNGGTGILLAHVGEAQHGNLIKNCTVNDNSGNGINVENSSVISGNVVSDNGGDGIKVNEGSLVIGNSIMGNGGYGLNCPGGNAAGSGYVNNVFFNNTSGATVNFCYGLGKTNPGSASNVEL